MFFTFEDVDEAEMYLGKVPVKVDMNTAMHILQQKETMPDGVAWGCSFPPVVNHTSSSVARHHPDFKAAKHGDFNAALRLVDDLVKDDKVAMIARRFPKAHVVYNHHMQGDGINMIPAAYAAKFSAAGMMVEHDIIAITNVSHTNASDVSRISRRMRFEGKVTKGVDYILLDDFITSGAELRDLRDFINSKGGNVVAMTTFGHGSFGKLRDIRIDDTYKQKLEDAGITDLELRKYGIASAIDCLTLGEAAKLFRLVNSRAKAETSQLIARVQRGLGKESSIPEMGEQIQGEQSSLETVSQKISKTITNVPHKEVRR